MIKGTEEEEVGGGLTASEGDRQPQKKGSERCTWLHVCGVPRTGLHPVDQIANRLRSQQAHTAHINVRQPYALSERRYSMLLDSFTPSCMRLEFRLVS